jgi:transposase InsO family protein
VQTPFHKKYALILLNNATWWITAPLMRHKSDALSCFVGHLLCKRAQYNITPKIFQSNQGGEFTSADFSAYLELHGIICKLTVHNTPKHNGAAERAWRTLLNIVWTLLFASNLPQKLWGEALQHAIYVYNRLPHSILGGRSPYEARFKTTPNLSNLWEFGSWVFVHITTNDKLAP